MRDLYIVRMKKIRYNEIYSISCTMREWGAYVPFGLGEFFLESFGTALIIFLLYRGGFL